MTELQYGENRLQLNTRFKKKEEETIRTCSPGTVRGIRLKQCTHTPSAHTQKTTKTPVVFGKIRIAAVPERKLNNLHKKKSNETDEKEHVGTLAVTSEHQTHKR